MPVMHSRYPESGQVTIDAAQCSRCGACAAICPAEVLTQREGRIHINLSSPFGCIACGHCMMVCKIGAITVEGRGLSPEDLRPLPDPAQTASPEALEALMRSRRSVRRFQQKAVPREVLNRIVDMAASAPMGIPPWDIGCTVIDDHQQIQALTAELIQGYRGFLKLFNPVLLTLLRPLLKKSTHDLFRHFVVPLAKSYVEGYEAGADRLFYEAPALLIFHHSPYAEATDAAIACTYAMLAAQALGLGSTIIGGAPPVLQRQRALCQRIGIPQGNTPSHVLILGYPATAFHKSIHRFFLPS